MDRGAWWATVQRITKELDMTEATWHTHTQRLCHPRSLTTTFQMNLATKIPVDQSRWERRGKGSQGIYLHPRLPACFCAGCAVAHLQFHGQSFHSLGPRDTAFCLVPSDLEMAMVSTVAGSREPGGSLDPVLIWNYKIQSLENIWVKLLFTKGLKYCHCSTLTKGMPRTAHFIKCWIC